MNPDPKEVEKALPVLSTKGIKIELYNKADEKITSYYIGGVTQNEKGTHFYKEGSDKTFVMEMPYGEVNIRQRFDIRYDDWKTRLIFKDNVDRIQSVKVDYPKSPSHGFIIQKNNSKFSIRPSISDQPVINRQLKPAIFEKYLINFKGVNFVEFNNEVTAKDSIMNNVPFHAHGVGQYRSGHIQTGTLAKNQELVHTHTSA